MAVYALVEPGSTVTYRPLPDVRTRHVPIARDSAGMRPGLGRHKRPPKNVAICSCNKQRVYDCEMFGRADQWWALIQPLGRVGSAPLSSNALTR